MATWRKVLVSGSAAVLSSVTSDAAITAGTSFVIGSADINETDLEKIDGITNGAGAANKALVLDGNADIASGVRNITITGTLSDGNYTFDTSGNVSGLGTVGSGNITSTGTVQGTTITATTAFAPDASDGAALGTSALEFSDLFLADGAVLSLGDGGADVTFTHVADTGVLLNSTNKIQFNDSSQYIGASSAADLDIAATTDVNIDATTLDVNAALDVSGATTLNGAVTLGNATGDDITNTGRWVGDFVPKSDSAIDLGTSALQFAEAHIDAGYIDAITATGTSTLTTVDINGGNIDGTTIGATTAAAATLAATVTTTLKNVSAVGASHLTGSFTGSFVGDGSNLTGVAQDIDTLNAYGAATMHQTQDKLLISDNGTEKSITFSNFEDSIFANISGDATIAAGGALTLASNSVSQAQLDDDAVGADELAANAVVNASIASGAAIDMDKLDGDSLAGTLTDFAQDDLVILSDTDDSGDLKKMTTSNFEDAIFGNVSGDAAIAAGGALTIAAASVEGSMLNDNVISGQSNLGSATVAQSDEFLFSDAGTIKALTFSNLEDSMFANFSSEATVAAGGAVTLAATNTSLTTLANLTTAGALNAGSITTGFGAINNGASAITTTGTITGGALSITANATINGDLTVNGTTTTLSTTNLAVGDSFIFAATGSAASNVDGGLIVQEGASVDSGSAIYHDTGDNRWSVAKEVAASATAVTALEHVVTVKQLGDNDDPVTADKEYGAGEMAINSDGTIWIFS
jgi:hypothetical protein